MLLGFGLRGKSLDLLAELRNALAQQPLLAGAFRLSEREQGLLAGQDLPQVRLMCAGQELRRKDDAVGSLALRLETRFARAKLIEAAQNDAKTGARLGAIEQDQKITRGDRVAFLDVELLDDPTRRVLHLLDIVFDNEGSRGNDSTRQSGRRGPAAHAADQDNHDRKAKPDMPAYRRVPLLRDGRGLQDLPPTSATEAGRRTRCSTSALGPKAWTRPSASTSSMSTQPRTFGR